MVVTSDSRGSGKLVPFGKTLPEQIVEVGIAEQNLVGISAGLASTGKKVFAVSPACFLTTRALGTDQERCGLLGQSGEGHWYQCWRQLWRARDRPTTRSMTLRHCVV